MNLVHKTHWSFWLVALFGLLWSAMGAMNIFMQMNAEMLSQMPPSHRYIAETRPFWASAAFAVSVIAGVFGCLLLLLKKPSAVKILAVSLLGTLGATAQLLFTHNIFEAPINFGTFEVALMVAAPILVSIFLVWYAKRYFAN